MKRTYFYQFPGQLGGRPDADRVWWPDDCQTIIRDVHPSEDPAEALEAAAEAVMVAEYRDRERRFGCNKLRHDDDLLIYVSASRDVPGELFEVALVLDPSAVATRRTSKRPIRLPNDAELIEAAA